MLTFKDPTYTPSEYLREAVTDTTFEITDARVVSNVSSFYDESFEIACKVVSGPHFGKVITTKFFKNRETGDWHGFLKYFLTRFSNMYTEEHGLKLLNTPIDERLLVGQTFIADALFSEPGKDGKQYLNLKNIKSAAYQGKDQFLDVLNSEEF